MSFSCQRIMRNSGPVVAFLFVLAILAVTISEIHSFDVFWQLQSGGYIWETGHMIHSDLFTLAADAPRVEHTWLHGLILYALYSAAGYPAISVLKGLVLTGTFSCLILVARRRDASWPAILLVTPLFMLTSGGWLERPQIWTFLLFALFLLVIEGFLRQPSWRVLWLFPLMVFWVNVHAGAVLALAVLAAYLCGQVGSAALHADFRTRGLGKLLVAALLLTAATLVTPYPGYVLHVLTGVAGLGGSVDASGQMATIMAQKFNMDWTLTTFQAEPRFFYLLATVALVMLLGWRKFNLVDLCLLAGLALMGLKLVRHIPFFYFGVMVVLPRYLDAAASPLQPHLKGAAPRVAAGLVVVAALALFAWQWLPLYRVYGTFSTGLRGWHYPISATEFVREHQLAKNLYNTYDWGGYMAWKLFPEYKVFWDGRQNSSEMFALGWQVMAGRPSWQQILDRFGVKTIVTRASTIDTGQMYPLLDRLKESDDWALVFNDQSSLVFVRQDSVPKAWLADHSRSKARIDDSILAQAYLMVGVNPARYMAWWEIARIHSTRRQYSEAMVALEKHFSYAPPGHRVAAAETLYRVLYPLKKQLGHESAQ